MRLPGSLLFTFLTAFPSLAQTGSVATPTLGFAFMARPRRFAPFGASRAAALLGDAMDAGFPIATAAIAPRQNFALAVAADDSRVRFVPLGEVTRQTLPAGLLTAPDQIRSSPSRTAASCSLGIRPSAGVAYPVNPAVRDIDLAALTPTSPR